MRARLSSMDEDDQKPAAGAWEGRRGVEEDDYPITFPNVYDRSQAF